MPDNERLCALAQAGDAAARELLIENNLGFIRRTALEVCGKAGESGLDVDDLVQEGCIGLLSAIDRFDAARGMKFLTYAAPAIRNAMTDCVRAALSQFERRLESNGLQRVYLDDVLDADEQLLRIEAVADPHTQTPEQVVLRREQLAELYAGLDNLTAREQTWLLYRHGFADGAEHPLTAAARHFHLSENRARALDAQAIDDLRLELPWWY